MTRTSTWTWWEAPTGVEALFIEGAQHFGLGLEAHVADLVEEEGAAVGPLERAALFGGAAHAEWAGSVAVAEEFGLDVVLGNRSAVELDEDAVVAQGFGVHGAADEFLAGAGLAVNEHAAVGGGHEFNLLAKRLHGDGLAGDGAA